MKTLPVVLIFIGLFFCGCASITPEQARITRFVSVPAKVLEKAIPPAATKRDFRPLQDGRWEYVVMYEKDPVLGLVTVSQKAQIAIRFAFAVQPVGEQSCRLTADPTAAFSNRPFSESFREHIIRNVSDRQRIIDVLDDAIAAAMEAQELSRQHGT